MRRYGHLDEAHGTTVRFSDDLDQRLTRVDTGFEERLKPLFDAYIAAAGIDAPPDDRPPPDTWTPPTRTVPDLDREGITTVLWATGYQLDFGWLDLPVLDQWGYPRHQRGVVGLPWLHSEPSSVLGGVGADAEHVVRHIVDTRRR